MGVDCYIRLPENVQVRDVADVIGIAAGLKPERRFLKGNDGSWYVEVNGLDVKPSCVVGLAEITLHGNMIDGESDHSVSYHFECTKGGRLLLPRSTAFWIAVGHRLVDFFGGTMDYQDCDSVYENYSKWPKSRRENSPQDGKLWQQFQERMEAVKPLMKSELKHYAQFAAYPYEETDG